MLPLIAEGTPKEIQQNESHESKAYRHQETIKGHGRIDTLIYYHLPLSDALAVEICRAELGHHVVDVAASRYNTGTLGQGRHNPADLAVFGG